MISFMGLFWLFAKIGIFTFGGGYAMIPLFQTELVPQFISESRFADLVALAQITPGPIGLNSATYIGYTASAGHSGLYRFVGAAAGTLGLMLPCLIAATLAAAFLSSFRSNKFLQNILFGIRPATLGLIAAAVVFFADSSIFDAPLSSLWKAQTSSFGVSIPAFIVFGVAIFCEWKLKLNVIFTILISGSLSTLLFYFL